jgi:hypothetical protein
VAVTDQQLTGAGVEVTLEDGTKFFMYPLDDRMIVEMDEWVRQRVVETAVLGAQAIPDRARREEVIAIGVMTAATASFLSEAGARIMGSIDGVCRMLWQSLDDQTRRERPYTSFRKQMMKPANVDRVVATFRRINSISSKKGSSPSGTDQQSTPSSPPGTSGTTEPSPA